MMVRLVRLPNIKILTTCLFVFLLLIATGQTNAQFVAGPQFYNQQGLTTINALGAFTQGYSGSGVTIGIVDSGVNPDHISVNGALIGGIGWSRTDPSNVLVDNWTYQTGTSNFSSFLNAMSADGATINDHGTFVSSVAAGRVNSFSSADNTMGVAYKANIVIGQIVFNEYDKATKELTGLGLNSSQIAQTINYVSASGAKVINNSWGASYPKGSLPTSMKAAMSDYAEESSAEINALILAQNRGAVIVFAAGNDGLPFPTPPATLPSINSEVAAKGGWIVVAATTNRGTNPLTGQIEMARINTNPNVPSYYTNFCGEAMLYCISAPGGLEEPDVPQGDIATAGASASTNTAYKRGEGTSYAAPFVTGAVALVAEKFPWMSAQNLAVTILTTGTTASDPSPIWGRGLLDVGKAMNGPGIFEQDFVANVTAGYRSTFSNNISGTAGLIKDGVGTLLMSGINTYSGATTILNGTLGLTGSGSISKSSAVTNAGVFDLTQATAVVTLSNTYVQTASGVLFMALSPGQGQQLTINGTATLAGLLAVQATTGIYAPGQVKLITAASIKGQFDTYLTNLGNYTSYKTYQSQDANNIFLNIVRPYTTTVIENGNVVSKAAAQVLYDIAGTQTSINGAMAPALNTINGLNSQAQSAAIRQTLPVLLGGASQATYNTQRAFQQTVMSRVETIRGIESGDYFASDHSVWIKPFGNLTNQSSLNDVPGYRASGGGLAVGIDSRLTDNTSVGGVLAYSYNAINGYGDNVSNNLGINSFQLGFYGTTLIDTGTDLNYQVDIGLNQNRETRSIGFINNTAQATYNSYTSHVGVGIRKIIPVTTELNAVPLLRIDYAAINASSYTESGAGGLNLNVQSQTYQELMLTAGLKADYLITDDVKLTANIGLGYNTLNNQAQIVASYSGGGDSFITQGLAGSPWLYSAGIGIVGYNKDGVELRARYDLQASPTGFLNQMVSIRASLRY